MTDSQKIEAYQMLMEGKTYREIGEEFGVSKQAVEKVLKQPFLNKSMNYLKRCPYAGLKKYLEETEMSVERFAGKICVTPPTARKRILGTNSFTIPEIRLVLKLTGMTFEECFAEAEDMK